MSQPDPTSVTVPAGARAVPPKLNWVGRSPSVLAGGIVLALVAAGGAVLVFFFDPTQTPFYPQCALHRLTGFNCPGCGATRAVYALLHGRWGVAWRDNALFLITGLALAGRGGLKIWDHWRQQRVRPLMPTVALIPWLVIALIFGVLRNLPAFSFLSPAN